MQLLLYPETALPFTTKAGSENCTGYYLETSGVLLFAWNMLPQGQVSAVSLWPWHVAGKDTAHSTEHLQRLAAVDLLAVHDLVLHVATSEC